jgi:putative alpha-1,2-mannosidase
MLRAPGACLVRAAVDRSEPDMDAPMSYAYAGRLDRLAEVITACKTYSFAPGRGGVCGNLDSGGEVRR